MLSSMRVASFCHYLQGPAATQYLADMGADVVKVEPPAGAFERHWSGANSYVDGISAFYLCANRNKRSLAVDLKRPEGREVALRLIAQSDVVVENFRPGVMERLGLGCDQLRRSRPELIYASATGFGRSGPLAEQPGQDLLIQARSGLAGMTGDPAGRPTPVGCAAADQHGAALLALGILGAYVQRLASGRGTRVDLSLLNAGLDLQMEALTLYMSRRASREIKHRERHLATWFHGAPYGVYELADGSVALSLNRLDRLAEALDSTRLAALSGQDPYEVRDRYAATLAEELAGRGFAELAPLLEAQGIWFARVQDYDDLRDDPQVAHNEVFREVAVGSGRATLVNHPLRYDGEVPPLRHLALHVGQHSREILAALGYSEAEAQGLIDSKAVAAPPAGSA